MMLTLDKGREYIYNALHVYEIGLNTKCSALIHITRSILIVLYTECHISQ